MDSRNEVDEYSFRRVARLLHYGRTMEEVREAFSDMSDSDFFLVFTAGQIVLEREYQKE
jgi:hypothetical protein